MSKKEKLPKRSVDEVAHKVDYAELRKIYFNYQPDKDPSHINDQSGLENFQDKNSKIHTLLTMMPEYENFLEEGQFKEMDDFKDKLSKKAAEILNDLYDVHGVKIYKKIIQLMKENKVTDWNQIEEELISGNIELLIEGNENPFLNDFQIQTLEYEGELEYPDNDLDYLDALVEQDYQRLSALPSDKGAISSIFSEILENEEQSNSNYQDDVFEKNIDLIFNSEIDLDHSDWEATLNKEAQSPKDSYSENSLLLHVEKGNDSSIQNNRNEMSNEEILRNLENSMPTELFQKEDVEDKNNSILEISNHEPLQSASNNMENKQEKIIIQKVINKRKANGGLSIGFITLLLLTFILAVAVIVLGWMVFVS